MKFVFQIAVLGGLIWGGVLPAAAQQKASGSEDTLAVRIYFKRGYSFFESSFRDNGARLDDFIERYRAACADTSLRVAGVRIESGASPEGYLTMNERLSGKRANYIVSYLRERIALPDENVRIDSRGIDWQGLAELVEASEVSYKEEVLAILRDRKLPDNRKHRLLVLRGGKPYWELYRRFFPQLRASSVSVVYCGEGAPAVVSGHDGKESGLSVAADTLSPAGPAVEIAAADTAGTAGPAVEPKPEQTTAGTIVPAAAGDRAPSARKPFYMALKTNMLYDAALVPNIGVEFYVGRGWTVGADWMYAWWDRDPHHDYWRIYGGELDIRKYFGRRAKEKPLTGHHVGLYGQMLTYDFELGGKGYMGGKPGGTLWDKMNWGVGIEYGYSLPIARRLNLDFGIGVGYFGGEYREYVPIDDCYVWQATKQRHWFGPTKAEVSLVWLIGAKNRNLKVKGGRR